VVGGVHELRAVVLADVEGVDPDRVGEDCLLDRVADDLVAPDGPTGGVDRDGEERVEAEFDGLGHGALVSQS